MKTTSKKWKNEDDLKKIKNEDDLKKIKNIWHFGLTSYFSKNHRDHNLGDDPQKHNGEACLLNLKNCSW